MSKYTFLFTVLFFSTLYTGLFAQTPAENPESFFKKYLNSKAFQDLCSTSLPSSEECKFVFDDQSASKYFSYSEELKKIMLSLQKKTAEEFVDIEIETFTTEDIKLNRGNYAGGMKSIETRLKEDVTFYKVTLLREKDAENGMAYKYWIYTGSKWIYFPKLWSAFRE